MVRVGSALVIASAAVVAVGVGCSSASSLSFGDEGPQVVDAGDETPYPDAPPVYDAPKGDAAPEALQHECKPTKDDNGRVCVQLIRGSEGPTLGPDSKSLGLDGSGAALVGLSAIKPGRDLSFVAQTWYPGESSGTNKVAAAELPKVAELLVAPGSYWSFAVFRDQEPFMRPSLAVGDYVPRLLELPTVNVVAGKGINVDVKLYPVRAVDVEVKLGTSPQGSGAGPLRAWLVTDSGKVVGEGGLPCAELAGGRIETVRIFTTYTGSFSVAAALFDFGSPSSEESGAVPTYPVGTLHNDASSFSPPIKVDADAWIAPGKRRVELDKAVSGTGTKPYDPSPTCASYAYAPPK